MTQGLYLPQFPNTTNPADCSRSYFDTQQHQHSLATHHVLTH